MSNRPARFTQADIARILRAAVQTGTRTVIEVEADGKIKIIANEEPARLEQNADFVL